MLSGSGTGAFCCSSGGGSRGLSWLPIAGPVAGVAKIGIAIIGTAMIGTAIGTAMIGTA